MRIPGVPSRAELAAWCLVSVGAAGLHALTVLTAIEATSCAYSLDPARFCAWWEDSGRAPAFVGVPAVLAFGCYASFTLRRRRPVVLAGLLVMASGLGLQMAAAPVFY